MVKEIAESEVEPEVMAAIHQASKGIKDAACRMVGGPHRAIFNTDENLYALVLSSDFNCAVSIGVDRSSFRLGINLGFARFLNELTKMLFSRIVVLSKSQLKSGDHPPGDAIPFEETAEAAKAMMEAFWTREIAAHNTIRESQLPEQTAMLYWRFLVQALRFSIGHEFGHVIIEISPSGREFREAGESIAEGLLQQLPAHWLTQDTRSTLTKDWGCEFAADHLGLQLALDAETTETFKDFQLYSVQWFFVLCDALWKYYAKTRGSISVGSHPPPHLRLGHIRALSGAEKRKLDMTDGLQKIIDNILETIS